MKRAPLYVLTCYILWGVLPVFWKLLAAVDSRYVLAGRIVWSLVFMAAAEVRGAGAAGVLHGWQWLLLPAAGVVTTVPLLFFAKGIKSTPMTLSGILMYINPTLQLLLSVLLYQEEFTTTHAILFGFVWSGLALYLLSSLLRECKHKKEETPCE